MPDIPCTCDCFYQCGGYCVRSKPACGMPSYQKGCPYYLPKASGLYLPARRTFNRSTPRWLV